MAGEVAAIDQTKGARAPNIAFPKHPSFKFCQGWRRDIYRLKSVLNLTPSAPSLNFAKGFGTKTVISFVSGYRKKELGFVNPHPQPPPHTHTHTPHPHPRAQELCESRGGRPGLLVPNSPYGFCGCKATSNLSQIYIRVQELCESRRGRPGLPVLNSSYGLCGC